jgi:hypothetical protein
MESVPRTVISTTVAEAADVKHIKTASKNSLEIVNSLFIYPPSIVEGFASNVQ